jgi:hypothetical protein
MRSLPVHSTRQVLNHALNFQRFSLANYLRYARPWASDADHVLLALVFRIAELQMQNANRIGELLVERHASVEPGTFPMRITGLNDLSIRYAAPHIVDDLEQIIHELYRCGELLRDDHEACEIVQAILRDEQRHLTLLRDELRHIEESEAADKRLVSVVNRRSQDDAVNGRRQPTSNVGVSPIPA